MFLRFVRRGFPKPANSSSYEARVNFQTAKINQIFQDVRKWKRRRERLTIVYQILLKLMPPPQRAVEDLWKSRFGTTLANSLPFEAPYLSICDIARVVNLREGRLTKYIHILRKNSLIIWEENSYAITFKGVQVLATLDATLNHPLVRPLKEDLESIDP